MLVGHISISSRPSDSQTGIPPYSYRTNCTASPRTTAPGASYWNGWPVCEQQFHKSESEAPKFGPCRICRLYGSIVRAR